ncbi:acyl carrier protein [Hydrogenophilus islandicus]
MTLEEELLDLVAAVLELSPQRRAQLAPDSPLLGALPELDSMAVLDLLHAIEARFDVTIEDDAVTSERFLSARSLAAWVVTLQRS